MSGIDTKVVSHRLAFLLSAKPVAQRKRKMGKEKRATIDERVEKLTNIGFITEAKYLTWMANVVLVQKAKNKWCMCMDFTDLFPAQIIHIRFKTFTV